MHIAHITLNNTLGGGEIQLLDLIEQLSKQGIPQTVITCQQAELLTSLNKKWVDVITLPKTRGFHPIALWRLKKLYKNKMISLIHTHDPHAHTLAIMGSRLIQRKIPIIASRKVAFPMKNRFFTRWKYNHSLVKRIICVSHAAKETLYPIVQHPEQLKVIYDGINISSYQQPPSNKLRSQYSLSEPLLIGIIGSLVPVKDHETFIETAKQLLERKIPAQFVIIGSGKLQTHLQKRVEELKLTKDIIFTGHRDDIAEILNELSCLLITSQKEGLCRVILEAMAAGIPIVATNTTGIKELIQHKQNGLLASVGNAKELADQVEYLLHTFHREQIIQAAKKFVQGFDHKLMAQHILSVYEEARDS